MISNPKHGWCDFDFNDFHDRASYTTCVPCDLLDGFIAAIEDPYSGKIVRLDAEGYEYYLVLTDYKAYVISEKDIPPHLAVSDKDVKELAKELMKDLEGSEQIYAENFAVDNDREEIDLLKHHIWQKAAKLKQLLEK